MSFVMRAIFIGLAVWLTTQGNWLSGNEIKKLKQLLQKEREAREKLEQRLKSLEERLEKESEEEEENGEEEDLEEKVESHESLLESITKTLERSVKLHGYSVFEFGDRNLEASTLAGVYGRKESFFRARQVNLLPMLEYQWISFYAELKFGLPREMKVENLWLELKYSTFRLRIGKFYTYLGLWNRIHRIYLLPTVERRTLLFHGIEHGEVFPEDSTGIEGEYMHELPWGNLQFVAWLVNGRGKESDKLDDNNHKSGGGRISFEARPFGLVKSLIFGGAFMLTKTNGPLSMDFGAPMVDAVFAREGDTTSQARFQSFGFTAAGEAKGVYREQIFVFHLKTKIWYFEFWSEYAINYVHPTKRSGAIPYIAEGFFVWLGFEFRPKKWFPQSSIAKLLGKFILWGMYQEHDANNKVSVELGSQRRLSVGVWWKIREFISFKLEFQYNRFVRGDLRNFRAFLTSLNFAF